MIAQLNADIVLAGMMVLFVMRESFLHLRREIAHLRLARARMRPSLGAFFRVAIAVLLMGLTLIPVLYYGNHLAHELEDLVPHSPPRVTMVA